jgi:CDP-paratose 2-epimerase
VSAAVGVLEWLCPGEYERAEQLLSDLSQLGISHLRTGVSWADYYTDAGPDWYDWLLPRLSREVVLLPCFVYTPPSLGIRPQTSAPPRDPRAYADWLDLVLSRHGTCFEHVELWNEPNNLSEWDWTLDPEWQIFSAMIGAAAYWVKKRGWNTVLGGMSPIAPNWLALMCKRGVMEYIDVVGIHGFPGVWEANWPGWHTQLAKVRHALSAHGQQADLWITETGYSTWKYDEFRQAQAFVETVDAAATRVYWYAAQDLHPARPTIDGFHEDEREYHFGLKRSNGEPKLLHRLLSDGGMERAKQFRVMAAGGRQPRTKGPWVLITGGAGFLGVHLAKHWLERGKAVRLLDNLSGPTSFDNLSWLQSEHHGLLDIHIRDLREPLVYEELLEDVETVVHLAAHTDLDASDPVEAYDTNTRGTILLVESLYAREPRPKLILASSWEVYGGLDGLEEDLERDGDDEQWPLRPDGSYACSKAAAEQYVLSQVRNESLPAVVLRLGPVFGPRQPATGESGWVRALVEQVVDPHATTTATPPHRRQNLLYISDCVAALALAESSFERLRGQVFNVGGEPGQSVRPRECLSLLDLGSVVHSGTPEWRRRLPGSDFFKSQTHWYPVVSVQTGLRHLHRWLERRHARRPESCTSASGGAGYAHSRG